MAGVLAGCGTDGPAAGAVLTRRQRSLVATIADHIIPETDTPGARAVGVDAFIDRMLAVYYPEEERDLFLAGLDTVDEKAEAAHGRRFLDCTPEEQLQMIAQLDREAFPETTPAREAPAEADVRNYTDASGSELPPEVEGDTIRWIHGERWTPQRADRPFYRTMKELTVVGYYTSEVGATRELRHEAVPGRYEGCIPLAQVGRTWAV